MPVPKQQGDALFILIAANPTGKNQSVEWDDVTALDGPTPTQFRSGADGYRLFVERLRPGSYSFKSRTLRLKDSERPAQLPRIGALEIGPQTINLCPVKLTRWVDERGEARTGVAPVTADDQRVVTAEISDYLNFGEWIGSRFVGFGPYRPRFSLEKDAYPFRVATRPAGARLLVDGQDWGTTPLTADLTPGRHQLAMEKEGFAITKSYITVESEGEIEVPLTPLAGQRQTAQTARARLVITPFRNLGSAEGEPLGPVFDDTIEIGFANRGDTIEPVRTGASATEAPDFGAAEREGGDLLAVGSYLVDDARLLVQAALYDVPSRMARGAITYAGPAGLAMFAGIDGMVEELWKGTVRELPPPGQPIIQQGDALRSVAYDRKRTEKEIIAKRSERKTSLVAQLFMGGEFDTIDDPPAFDNDMRMQTAGPAWGGGATYERQMRGPLSLTLITLPILSRTQSERGGNLLWEVPLYAGPRYTFLGYRTDLYWGLLAEARYVGRFTIEESGTDYEYGPYAIGGLTFDTGLKLYTYDRMSRPARFVNLGMMIGLLGLRTTLDFDEKDTVPLAIWLYCGLGGRL